MMQLSKSDYMLFLRHPAWLWLKKHDKAKLPAVDEALQALFDDGKLFETYADKLFPDAVRVGFSFEKRNYGSMPQRTKEVLQSGADTILQGRFEGEGITCIFDVLQKVGNNGYDLTEIKSSTEVKEDHILDLAFQTIVLENAGLTIRKMFVIHVNNEYVRNGKININEMTAIDEITEQVRAQIDFTKEQIQKALAVMNSSLPPSFSPRHVGIGPLSEWMAIYETLFPQTHSHSIYKLGRLNPQLVGQLEDLGIKHIADIPDTLELHIKQKLQIQVTKENKRIVDKKNIQEFLAKLVFPLYFFDYETFSTVIPPFDGIRPYQQVPFQYSLHIIDKPGGIMTHKEFLHMHNSHPGLPLLQQLKKDIGDKGTVLVWYEPFEKGRNTELGEMFPEYAAFMAELNGRIIDLMVPFSNNWFVDKDFFGSASIKKVMPVLISELSYEKLEIQEGQTASRTWKEHVLEGKHTEKKDTLPQQLLDYCRMDTLAMVKLYTFLKNLSLTPGLL